MLFLFPFIFYHFSPYLIIMTASEGVAAVSFVVFGLIFVASIFLGRAFCGWVCPAGAAQEGRRGFFPSLQTVKGAQAAGYAQQAA